LIKAITDRIKTRTGKWKTFEKLREAIEMAGQRGAVVRFNDEIDGHPFDATVRTRLSAQDFLVVVDCVAADAQVDIGEVDAFTTKAREVGARMAITASAAGYTQEATNYATENDIRLLTLETIQRVSLEVLADIFSLVLHAYDFKFLWADGTGETMIPEEPEILSFFLREMKINGPGIDTVPERLMKEQHGEIVLSLDTTPKVFEIPFPEGTTITHPNTLVKTQVKAFTFIYRLLSACDLKTKEGLGEDPYMVGSTLKEELAKRNPSADPSKIESGYDTTLEPGKYYYNPSFRFSYYCEAVKRSKATIVLVESYQMGRLVQALAELSTDLSSQFVEVTEQGELARLSKLYERFAVSDKNLEARFKVFVKNMDGAECIDELELTDEQERANKADYFFNNREVISELKALQTDTSEKIEKVLAPYKETPEWPIFFGKQDVQKILNYLPEKEKINRKLIEAVTESIEGIVEKANRQIRDTKRTFNLPDSGGLLVVLNDLVDILSPDLVAYRVKRALNKRTPTGELRFPNISVVMIIGGAHYAQLNPNLKGIPILIIPNDVPEAIIVEGFVSNLIKMWSKFDGQPLVTMDANRAIASKFRKFSDDKKELQRPRTFQEKWEFEYRKRPYLRSYSKEDLLQFGREAIDDYSPIIVKGAPKAPRERVEDVLIRLTHFFEEMRYRGIDMREFVAKLDGLKERMEELYLKYQEREEPPQKMTRAKQQRQSKAYKNKIGRGTPCPCKSGRTYSRCCGANQ
jgi:hypothetical protein